MKKYKVISQEYSFESGWYDMSTFEIEGEDGFVKLYLRVRKGDANSSEEDRAERASRLYNSEQTSFKWYRSENSRVLLTLV